MREREFVCGTRAVVRTEAGKGKRVVYRVVCATCGKGGTTPHDRREDACRAAVRDSNKLFCGCRR